MRQNLIDITMVLHHETQKAILVSEDGDSDKAKWLPKSLVEMERKPTSRRPNVVIVTTPEQLAIDKGLI